MRLAGILLMTGTVLGCASPQVADNAANPAPAPVHEAAANTSPPAAPAAEQGGSAPAATPAAAPAPAPAAAAKTTTTKSASLPRMSGYKVVTKDGKQLYCTREPVTGSLLQTASRCYTPEQLEALRKASQEAVDEVSRRTSPTAGGS